VEDLKWVKARFGKRPRASCAVTKLANASSATALFLTRANAQEENSDLLREALAFSLKPAADAADTDDDGRPIDRAAKA
jgi:hypothetical protein